MNKLKITYWVIFSNSYTRIQLFQISYECNY
nr:MAG TPA: hypothetical protein [Caudoviricetes sp.]